MIDPGPADTTEALAESLLSAVGLMRRHLRRSVGRPWPRSPLTASQAELVKVVRHSPGISVAEAASELGLVPNTVSTLVGQLTEQGLLRRSPDRHDRRVARLTLTPSAQRQVEAWRDRRIALVTQVLDGLDREEREALRAALPTLGSLAERLRPDGGQEAGSPTGADQPGAGQDGSDEDGADQESMDGVEIMEKA